MERGAGPGPRRDAHCHHPLLLPPLNILSHTKTDAMEAAAASAVAAVARRADRYAVLLGVAVGNAAAVVLVLRFAAVDGGGGCWRPPSRRAAA